MTPDPFHQEQFLDVIDRDEAERRFHAVLDLRPLEANEVALADVLGRVLAEDVVAPVDVPGFDRSNVDGFALRAEDSFGASEDRPRILALNPEILSTGMIPLRPVDARSATVIATGGVVPRGANAVVMIEYTDVAGGNLLVLRAMAPGANITFAGTDIGRGETVLRRGEVLTSRETGVLAALGMARVRVVRRPRVAIVSTGNELIAPGTPMRPGLVYDSNATILADAVRELGGEPINLGIVPDNHAALEIVLHKALEHDAVLLSGGTSKGIGDLSYRVVATLGPPGIVAHGVALKPGKPLCLAAVHCTPRQTADRTLRTVPVVILPGFPTSAIFTFQEFVAPVLLSLGGRPPGAMTVVSARLPFRVNSERGRTEYLLVSLIHGPKTTCQPNISQSIQDQENITLTAFPMGKGSGSVTTFSRADGFVVIPRQREYLEAGDRIEVHLLGQGLRPADLVVIGSHCIGLDYLLGRLQELGFHSKFLAVGSSGGLEAARQGQCDLAGIHLLDPKTNIYNLTFVGNEMILVPGYGRLQGIVFRPGDHRFESKEVRVAMAMALGDPECVLINRNRGSGTRLLIDKLLGDARPSGYLAEARSHNSVVSAIAQGRADWGVAISTVARDAGLGFLPLQEEQYDFLIPRARLNRPAVQTFQALLAQEVTRQILTKLGFHPISKT